MRHTIIADASFCPQTGAAGYAFWYASERVKYGGAGPMKTKVSSSGVAEMMAVVNGLHDACMKGHIDEGDTVLLQTDCKEAISAFKGSRRVHSVDERTVAQHLHNLERSFKLRITYRYVPGHTNGETARTATNNICDAKAKIHMRNMRHKLKTQALKDLLK